MVEGSAELSEPELETLRTGIRILALRRLGDPEAAEEVAQETLARALAALRNGRGPEEEGKLGAFVTGIARHVIADTLQARGRTVSLETAQTSDPEDSRPDPLTALIAAAEREAVRSALVRLSPRDQQILELCFFDGLKPQEVARRLGEPDSRIRKRKSRALERLRGALAEARGHETTAQPTKLVED